MKNNNFDFPLVLILYLLTLPFFSLSAQTKGEKMLYNLFGGYNTYIEKAGDVRMQDPGYITLSEYTEIGDLGDITFQLVTVKNLETQDYKKYARFRYVGMSPKILCVGTLTHEEVNKCLQLFLQAKEFVLNSPSNNYLELKYVNDLFYLIGVLKPSKQKKCTIFFSTNYLSTDHQISLPISELDNTISIFRELEELTR